MSLQQVPGGPTQADIAQFSSHPEGNGVSGKYATVNEPKQAKPNEYPVVPFAPDSYDTIASIKQNIGADANKDFGQKWMVPFTDADAAYLLRQQEQLKNANYDRWLWQRYDLTDPAQSWMFQQIAPEQYEKRKALIMYEQNLATRYAMLRLYGPKNQEDLMLQFLVETKQIELPAGPVWDPERWMANQSGFATVAAYKEGGSTTWRKRYTAGLFSPLKPPNENQTGQMPQKDNRADAWGSNSKLPGQTYAGSKEWNEPYKYYGKDPEWANQYNEKYTAGGFGFGNSAAKATKPQKYP